MLNELRFVRLSLWLSVKSNKCSVSSFCHLFCNTYNYAHFKTVERDLLLHPAYTHSFPKGTTKASISIKFHAHTCIFNHEAHGYWQHPTDLHETQNDLRIFEGILLPECVQTFCNHQLQQLLESTLLFFFPIKSQTVEKSKCSKTVRFLMYVQIVPIQIQPQINRCLCEEVCCCTRKWLRWKVQFVIIGRHLVVAEWKEPKTKSNSKTASE